MISLCPLSDWVSTVQTRGLGKGNSFTTRLAVAANGWNWIVGTERQDTPGLKDKKYCGNMRIFLSVLWDMDANLFSKRASAVVLALSKLTGKEVIMRVVKTQAEAEVFGRNLDEMLGTSFMLEYPPTVIRRLFKREEEEEVEEEAEVEV